MTRKTFQANLNKKIDPETAKAVIVITRRPNRAMHEIRTSVNNLPKILLGRNDIDKGIIMFEETYRGCER